MENKSNISGFILLGFPGIGERFYLPVSIVLFLVFLTSLIANCTVIALIAFSRRLHQPMYILILNLAISDLLFDIITLPKIVSKYWFEDGWISFAGCVFQMYSTLLLGCVDIYVFLLMAIDRYIAICKPLRHSSLITNRRIISLCCFFWFFSALIALVITILDFHLEFCDQNIRSCYCNTVKVLSLACSDEKFRRSAVFSIALFVLLLPLLFIGFSYGFVISVIITQRYSENRRRAFYTCSTQLSMICLYFIPRLFVMVADQVRLILNEDLNALLLCIYSFVPHIANPIIYCLRTQEIRRKIRNHIKWRVLMKTRRIPDADVN
ncbi:olfactory receptor 6B9-like [Gastrophryne carolinensis]